MHLAAVGALVADLRRCLQRIHCVTASLNYPPGHHLPSPPLCRQIWLNLTKFLPQNYVNTENAIIAPRKNYVTTENATIAARNLKF